VLPHSPLLLILWRSSLTKPTVPPIRYHIRLYSDRPARDGITSPVCYHLFYMLYIFSYTLYRFRRSLKITSLHISVSIEAIQLPSYSVRHSQSNLQCQEGPFYVEFAPFVVMLPLTQAQSYCYDMELGILPSTSNRVAMRYMNSDWYSVSFVVLHHRNEVSY